LVATVGDRRYKRIVPERLRRLTLIFQRTPIYFVTCCTANRQPFLATKEIHATFVKFAESGEIFGAFAGRYVIMPDHLHLFVCFDEERINLSRWMKALKGSLSASFRNKPFDPPFWQKGFFDHVLRSAESYEEKWHYVRDNPVRTRLVPTWQAWPYAGEIFDLEFRFEL
jgi:putative transposase